MKDKNLIIIVALMFMMSFMLIGTNAFALDVSIDGDGNLTTGSSNGNGGNLEVFGGSAEDAIVGLTGDSGKFGVYGENTTDGGRGYLGGGNGVYGFSTNNTGVYGGSTNGYAGYFQGDTRITGNLIVDGTLGETDPTVAASVKDGVDWSELTGIPAGFADNVDDEGSGGGTGVCNQACKDDFESRIAALETLLLNFTKVGNDVIITGANLQVKSGGSSTNDTVDGTGNIIIGFNEARGSGSAKSGSHNLIVGDNHNYSSYGGIVIGFQNTISAPYASVSGGEYNTASGNAASVSGGAGNTANAFDSSVSGGQSNTASNSSSSVSGGDNNTASGIRSSVSGGVTHNSSGTHDWRAGALFQDQ